MKATGAKSARFKKTVLALLESAGIEYKTIAFLRETNRKNASAVVIDSDKLSLKFFYAARGSKYTPEQCAYHEVGHVITHPLLEPDQQDVATWELVTRRIEKVLMRK